MDQETQTEKPPGCCARLRLSWKASNLQPMVIFVLFTYGLLDYTVNEKLKVLLCEEHHDEWESGENCSLLTSGAVLDDHIGSVFRSWMLLKSAIVGLPVLLIAPIAAVLLDKLPNENKHFLYFLAPVGFTLSCLAVSIGYTLFKRPSQVILSLIPLSLTGAVATLQLMAFAFIAYETVGKMGRRVTKFVFLQAMFNAGQAFSGIILAILIPYVSNVSFTSLSVVLGATAIAYVATKTRLNIDDYELILAGLRSNLNLKQKLFHSTLLAICAMIYSFTKVSTLPNYGAVSYTLNTFGLLLISGLITVQLRKKIIEQKILPKYEAPIVGVLGFGTMALAKVVYLIPGIDHYAPYIASIVNAFSQLGITMVYLLLCTTNPRNPALGLLWATIGSVIGSVPAEFAFLYLSVVTEWSTLPFLVQALMLIIPVLILLYFYYFYKYGKGAPQKDFGDSENEAFFRRDLKRSYDSTL